MPPRLASQRFLSILSLAAMAQPGLTAKALGELLRGRRVRSWNLLNRAASRSASYYQRWIKSVEVSRINRQLGGDLLAAMPGVAVIIVGQQGGVTADFEATAASVRKAFGDRATINAVPNANLPSVMAWLNIMARSGAHGWILPLMAGDVVSPYLAGACNQAIRDNPKASIIFWDEDRWNGGDRSNPWIKPAWDKWLFLARDTLTGAAIFSLDLAREAVEKLDDDSLCPGAFAKLTLRMARLSTEQAAHIPLILTHRGEGGGFSPANERCAQILSSWPERVQCDRPAPLPGFVQILPADPEEWPTISIIIPTRDRGDLLDACINSLDRLSYRGQIEIIIADNGTTEPRAVQVLERLSGMPAVKIVETPGPFNFSRINNVAAAQASGDLLCLLNNDVEAIDDAWLTRMARFAVVDGVGAVGAQLLYPNRAIQHAGIGIGIGGAAGHIEKGRMADDCSFIGWHGVTREVSAVTAACLVVRKDLFNRVGGLDEQRFPVAFNDVDFCLKLRALGLQNLIVADAQLIHHESLSRGDDLAAANYGRFRAELGNLRERWGTSEFRDPYVSPLFSLSSEQCLLSFDP